MIKNYILKKYWLDFKIKQEEEQEPIGWLYCGYFRGMSLSSYCSIDASFGPGQSVRIDFFPIKLCDIEILERNRFKFFDTWFSLDDFVFKEEPESKKEEIKARYQKEKEKNLEENKWAREKENEIWGKSRHGERKVE